jgi:phage baseplate assembly protein W
MIGMDRWTGKRLSGERHLQMRIVDVLSTMKKARVMRREYGSDIIDLQDAPINQPTIIEYYAGIVDAFSNPINGLTDVVIDKIKVESFIAGKLEISIDAHWVPNGEPITLSNVYIE